MAGLHRRVAVVFLGHRLVLLGEVLNHHLFVSMYGRHAIDRTHQLQILPHDD